MFGKIVSEVHFMHKGQETILTAGNKCREVSNVHNNITTVFFKISFLLKTRSSSFFRLQFEQH